jgi:hypothetical protein
MDLVILASLALFFPAVNALPAILFANHQIVMVPVFHAFRDMFFSKTDAHPLVALPIFIFITLNAVLKSSPLSKMDLMQSHDDYLSFIIPILFSIKLYGSFWIISVLLSSQLSPCFIIRFHDLANTLFISP